VRRRDFLKAITASAAAWPLAARAQQSAFPVIAFVRSTSAAGSEHLVAAFEQGLKEAGFVAGQNIAIDYRDRLPTNEIGHQPGQPFYLIVAPAKRLGLPHDLVPQSVAIAALFHPASPGADLYMEEVEKAGQTIGRQVLIVRVTDEREFPAAFATMVQQSTGELLIGSGPYFLSRRRQLAALAVRYALPSSGSLRSFAEAGVLMSYGAGQTDAYRRAGNYAGRILKGASPANMPVELATKVDLVINMATAKALGLNIPPNLLTLADEVSE
jgi:putative tryptophan/tyrosine transport system substrate-binding protein